MVFASLAGDAPQTRARLAHARQEASDPARRDCAAEDHALVGGDGSHRLQLRDWELSPERPGALPSVPSSGYPGAYPATINCLGSAVSGVRSQSPLP